MVNKTNRVMVLTLVSCITFSSVSFVGADTPPPSISSGIKNNAVRYAWYSALAVSALMVYRLESKTGPCENVSYDFNSLMRSNEGYKAKLKQVIAWVDRYIIGQPYKSSKVKAKNGELVIEDTQEPLGVMGIAQSSIKPAFVGLGAAYFINNPNSEKKLDEMGWLALFAIALSLK